MAVARHIAIPGGGSSSQSLQLLLLRLCWLDEPQALVQGGPSSSEEDASSEDSASSDSVMALRFAIPGGRTSPTYFSTAEREALVVPVAPGQRTQLHQNILQVRILTWRYTFANPGG